MEELKELRKLDTGISVDRDGFYGFRTKKKMHDGKVISRSGTGFKTQVKAKKALREAKIELEEEYERRINARDEIKRVRIQEVYDEFMENQGQKYRYGTLRLYDTSLRQFIEEMSKKDKNYVDEVSAGDVSDYLNKLYETGNYLRASLRNIKCRINNIFTYARQKEYVEYNVVREAVLTKESTDDEIEIIENEEDNKDKLGKVYSEEEFREILEVLKDTDYLVVILIGYYMGTRVAESCGLEWSAINWDAHTMDITQQLQYQDGMLTLTYTKTVKGRRKDLFIPDPLYEFLVEFKKNGEENRVQKGEAYQTEKVRVRKGSKETFKDTSDFICRRSSGRVIRHNCNNNISKILEKNRIYDFKTHSLRKTHATLISKKISPESLKNRLGHESIETTLKYYIKETKDDAAAVIEALHNIYG